MNHHLRRPITYLVLGLGIGLIVGLNVSGLWPQVPLHATATQGQENFAIATGLVDDQTEAIFFLDFLTGDLKAAVINPHAGRFNGFFQYNILSDFGMDATKNPKYLMVTGLTDIPRGGRPNYQLSRSIVYVAEATSGQVAAYAIPWNQTLQASRKPQKGTFVPLDKRAFRTTLVRPE